jgi:predicted lysophospholipase L1 biosynthesis ABC-type transport system permease subunit
MFTDHDRAGRPQVALINDVLARRYWPGSDPVTQRITVQSGGKPLQAEIVGVVGSVRHDGLDRELRPEVFLPHAQSPSGSMTIVVRAGGDPFAQLEAAKRQVWAVDPLQAFYRTATLKELVARTTVERRFSVVLLASLAGIALILSIAGVYALLSFSTRNRTQEFGVRIAMGATGAGILRMVLIESARLAAAGIVLGLALAMAFGRMLRGFLFGVAPDDPLTLAAVAVLLAAATLVASIAPARRASRIDPALALRGE